MDPTKDDPSEHQHKDQDQATQKQEPANDESFLIPPHVNRAASPSSTISSGYGPTNGMFPVNDEGLPEVVPDTTPQALTRLEAEYKRKYLEGDAPQTVIPKDMDTTKIAVMGAEGQYAVAPDQMPGDIEGAQTSKRAANRICGLRRRTFLILVVIVIVVAAAVGGGVGGGLANKSKGESSSGDGVADGASTTESTSTPTSTPTRWSTSSTTSTASTSSPTPTFLNNRTTSSDTFAFQAFAADTFLGKATTVIDDEGGTDLGFDAHSYVWLPSLTDCCITFCTNATSKGMVGWLCSKRTQPKSSDAFNRVYVWCHQKHEKLNAICIDPKT